MIGLIFSWFQEIRAELRLICYCPQRATDLYFPPEKEKRKEVRKSSAACEELPKLSVCFLYPKAKKKVLPLLHISQIFQRSSNGNIG